MGAVFVVLFLFVFVFPVFILCFGFSVFCVCVLLCFVLDVSVFYISRNLPVRAVFCPPSTGRSASPLSLVSSGPVFSCLASSRLYLLASPGLSRDALEGSFR